MAREATRRSLLRHGALVAGAGLSGALPFRRALAANQIMAAGALPATPDCEPPPSPSPGYTQLFQATPQIGDLTNDPNGVNNWISRAFQARIKGNSVEYLRGSLAIEPAPDGRPAIRDTFFASNNKSNNWGFDSGIIREVSRRGLRTANVTVDLWIEPQFAWRASTALKLFGMQVGQGLGAGLKVRPANQPGSYGRAVLATPTGLSTYIVNHYSYHLNRSERPDSAGRYWGISYNPRQFTNFPRGRWVTVEYEVTLNNHSQSDGRAKLIIDGITTLDQGNVKWQAGNWGFTAFGLTRNESKNAPFQPGNIYFSNFRLKMR